MDNVAAAKTCFVGISFFRINMKMLRASEQTTQVFLNQTSYQELVGILCNSS